MKNEMKNEMMNEKCVEKVLFIRHGETDYNRRGRLQGIMQNPLNARGEAQAAALARYLENVPIDALYTSPIRRAQATADIISSQIGLPARADARLREIEFGIFEGLTFAQVARRFPQAHRDWTSGYLAYRVPQGESRLDVARRMRAAWHDLTAHDEHKTIALVTHGSAIGILLGSLYASLPGPDIPNTSITTLLRREAIWEIQDFAQCPHGRGADLSETDS